MCYSSEDDFEYLKKKTEQLYSIGIRKFGLLLDDIPEKLAHEDDAKLYGETVNAHIDLINRYYNYLLELDGSIELTICPTQYHGKGNEYSSPSFSNPADGQYLLDRSRHLLKGDYNLRGNKVY